jgi:hypothetical protein
MRNLIYVALCVTAVGCSDDEIDSDEAARRAYLCLDQSIQKSLTLGFAGFNAASSANIDPQMTAGAEAGTLTITGQVDQGSSDNKGMRLNVGMVAYSDGALVIDGEELDVDITYDTNAALELQPFIQMQLKGIPTGTLTGTLGGAYQMSGDIEGETVLELSFSGMLQDDGTGKVIRVPGTTRVTGSATSGDGRYEVDVTL